MTRTLVIVALVASGCIRVGRPAHYAADGRKMAPAPETPACKKTSTAALWLNIGGTASGALGGAAATGAGIFTTQPTHDAMVGLSVALPLAGAALGYAGSYEAAKYSKECP